VFNKRRGYKLDSKSDAFLTEERVTNSALPPKLSVELGEREIWQSNEPSLKVLGGYYHLEQIHSCVVSRLLDH
jgi:hypothetical protein